MVRRERVGMLAIETKHFINEKDNEYIPEKESNTINQVYHSCRKNQSIFTANGWTTIQQIMKVKRLPDTCVCRIRSVEKNFHLL